ncbi:MAG: YlmH/Sll1252 family protein [Lachnospiraceae bacterium]|nr:YlmH/Sll1252 family protein [Lachnospiraceae bacterium]MDY5742386.1 YlmH/Sll1252 family protein [Lachnospiraceae bacterium]
MKTERKISKYFHELSERAYMRDIPVFSHFLTLNEQTILLQHMPQLPLQGKLYGGAAYAERQLVGFFPDAFSAVMEDSAFPLTHLLVSPSNPRFAEELSHRDVLGACMNLGIKRETLGDIYTREKQAVIIASERIAEVLQTDLTKIRHTTVSLIQIPKLPAEFIVKSSLDSASVSSLRLDVFLAELFTMSRKAATDCVEEGRAMINSLPVYSKNYQMKTGDLLSVRGCGRIRFIETFGASKKGKIWIHFERFS